MRGPDRRRRLTLLVGLALSLGAGASPADNDAPAAAGSPPAVLEDLAYGSDRRQTLDVYRPAGVLSARPIVIFWHGGSWQRGSKTELADVAANLAGAGFVAVMPNYRLYPKVGHEGFLHDAASAFAFVADHAREWGGDRTRIVLGGYSAGGHIAALLALDGRWLRTEGHSPAEVAGLVGLAGTYDFLPSEVAAYGRIFGPPEGHPATQPVNHVSARAPPTLLLHGDDDWVVPVREAEALASRLTASGARATLIRYRDIGHLRILRDLATPGRAEAPVLADVVRFVNGLPARQ